MFSLNLLFEIQRFLIWMSCLLPEFLNFNGFELNWRPTEEMGRKWIRIFGTVTHAKCKNIQSIPPVLIIIINSDWPLLGEKTKINITDKSQNKKEASIIQKVFPEFVFYAKYWTNVFAVVEFIYFVDSKNMTNVMAFPTILS